MRKISTSTIPPSATLIMEEDWYLKVYQAGIFVFVYKRTLEKGERDEVYRLSTEEWEDVLAQCNNEKWPQFDNIPWKVVIFGGSFKPYAADEYN